MERPWGGFLPRRQGMGRGAGRGPGAVYRRRLAALDPHLAADLDIIGLSDEPLRVAGLVLVAHRQDVGIVRAVC